LQSYETAIVEGPAVRDMFLGSVLDGDGAPEIIPRMCIVMQFEQ